MILPEAVPGTGGPDAIEKLIINSPYEEPAGYYWFDRDRGSYERKPGRRPAGYTKATEGSKRGSDAGFFEEIPHINKIRAKVTAWRDGGYAGATHTTKRLLRRWYDQDLRPSDSRFFYCQLEAIETIIWAHEIGRNDSLIRGLEGDGSPFTRLCCKMATGTGKTVVMAMLIAWQVLNAANNRGSGFTRNILIVAPSISVRRRLKVLEPSDQHNYYKKFEIVDATGLEKLNGAKIIIHNWHVLMTAATQKKPSGPASRVMLDIPVSDTKFSKDVLCHTARNILVINDEAHHAWRPMNGSEGAKGKEMRDEEDRATRWMEGLDRIAGDRSIQICYDFSATPFRPTGHSVSEVERFKWVISDFSLEDAIESGLVKTPRTPKHDDSGRYTAEGMSRFHHMFPEIRGDFRTGMKAEDPLPQLVTDAYDILGNSWKKTHERWTSLGHPIPPVMITVCNSTRSSERIVHHFEVNAGGRFKDLAGGMERIDSVALDREDDGKSSGLRTKIDTVGRVGEPGQDITHVVSVNMLTEGWDAHNVTHIMGLRAFESQLLCEQVVGRGLRRKSYEVDAHTGLLLPEYVDVFGIPFAFMPHEGQQGGGVSPQPVTAVYPEESKAEFEMGWPKGSVKRELRGRLSVGRGRIPVMEVDGTGLATSVTVVPSLAGKPMGKETELRVGKQRLQEFVFHVSAHVYSDLDLGPSDPYKVASVIRAVDDYVGSGRIRVVGVSRTDEDRYVRALQANMNDIVKHVGKHIKYESTDNTYLKPDDPAHPFMSTRTMPRWYSRRKWLSGGDVGKCHLNVGVYDSNLERDAMRELEGNPSVRAWVKNDRHVGFSIPYHFRGAWHSYIPDFLAALRCGTTAVIETKGAEEEAAGRKQEALDEWIGVVNDTHDYGTWTNCGLVRDTAGLKDAIRKACSGLDGRIKTASGGTGRAAAKCPVCSRRASGHNEIDSLFGFRRTNGITRPQSWCKKCRNAQRA